MNERKSVKPLKIHKILSEVKPIIRCLEVKETSQVSFTFLCVQKAFWSSLPLVHGSMITTLKITLAAIGFFTLAACGNQIGDSCARSVDCSSAGDRICDTTSPDGYCTVFGCDVGTCPDESVCVRFFSASQNNRTCDPQTEDVSTDDCSFDEFCTLKGLCSLRNAEIRYCMKTCGGAGDCRDNYECRDLELMQLNGGEPVPAVDEIRGESLENFCAAAPI